MVAEPRQANQAVFALGVNCVIQPRRGWNIGGSFLPDPAEGHGQHYAQRRPTARLSGEGIFLLPSWGKPLSFTLRDIVSLTAADHRIRPLTSWQGELTVFHLGYRYDDFFRILSQLRNEQIITDLLMNESIVRPGTKARCARPGDRPAISCEVRRVDGPAAGF